MIPRTRLYTSHPALQRHALLVRPPSVQRTSFATSARRLVEEAATAAGGNVEEQTAMLYLDNVFPLRVGILDIRQWFFRNTMACMDRVLPSPELIPHGFKIKRIEPRIKDGGAVVEFAFNSKAEDKKRIAYDIVEKVSENLKNHRASFNMQPIRTFLVKGEPFYEDMVARYPSPRLRIEFQGEPVTVERLYKHLRKYGRIYDIAVYPNPYTSKDPPRYAIAQFTRIRSATSARNCLHGHFIQGQRINILYERQLRTNVVKEWIMEHPRITVPIGAALLAGLTYSVFDPMREFFIASKVTQRFNPEEYALYRWLRRETWARLVQPDRSLTESAASSVWAQDQENMDKLRTWLREDPETFIVISGPKGSGKSSVVNATTANRRNKITIDCEELANTRNQTEMTLALAKQLGYFPVFTWIASLSKLLDTLVTATTGQNAGLASSPHAQIKKILETTAVALREIMPEDEDDEDGYKKNTIWKAIQRWWEHEDKKNARESGIEFKAIDPREEIPVVVIDNFMCRDTPKQEQLWNELADFAGLLVENEVAHVVFVTSNVGVNKILTKALPGKSFETVQLSDVPPEVSLNFIARQLGQEKVDPDLRKIVESLGGRLTELELFVQRLKMNMEPAAAFEDIVQRNVVEIRKYGFNEGAENELEDVKVEWTGIQFWQIVKALTESKSINYDELKWSPFFKGQDKPLWAMERAEIITIFHKNGRPNSVRPGKPIMYTVFDRLVADTVFNASMEIESHQFLKSSTEESLAKLQDTVIQLSRVYNGKPPKEFDTRIRYLLSKIGKLQKDIETYEKSIADNKKLLVTSWEDGSY
ncbi:rna12 protein [Lichtheimia corymbifera JMRC:FSU:9682]|uniref:Mitochondrial escape protein 2 n=1 Tax=Lichtheimia corymbifera JMRC:FSU:9682 TaxID=1263082 RepID=A0A068SGJ7_9FUNG|nr:rna12 protein [Lichtheimia corymbifera JMRC:FSU:9682]